MLSAGVAALAGVPAVLADTEVIGSTVGLVTVFALAVFVGFEVVSKVSSILHTPLMSGANAIHGIILIGSMLILGYADGALEVTLGFVAVLLATVNVVGGFVVTDRMLAMFTGRRRGPGTGERR